EDRQLLATITVTNTNDGGAGSLRAAILISNFLPGPDTINFQVGVGAKTIRPLSPLPDITDPVSLNATTQPGFAGKPLIELDGSLAGLGADGLRVRANNTAVRGLAINRFSGDGIELVGSSGNVVAGNFIGTDPTGLAARGNGQHGVFVNGGSLNNIGG